MNAKSSSPHSPDALKHRMCTSNQELETRFSLFSLGDDKPFDFIRAFYDGIIAGGTAGVVVEAALYPIDTIKTRLQAVHGGGKIIWRGLYTGLAGNLAGVLPASAVFLGVYEPAKQKLLKTFPENLSAFAHLTAGAIGGAASSFIRVPTEVVKQRMQTGQFASAPDAVRLIVSNEGFKGLYAGFGSFLLRDLPFDAIQFCIYEQLRIGYKLAHDVVAHRFHPASMSSTWKKLILEFDLEGLLKEYFLKLWCRFILLSWQLGLDEAKRELNDPENAIIGAFAGAITGAMTTPLDVIKTRMMVQGSANQYRGIFDCVRTIIREEGTPALLKGIGPRVLWIGIGGSIFFGVLERTKQLLAQRRPEVNHPQIPDACRRERQRVAHLEI
ncbi:S-adenosylmethionine carrier 1, chloroplastic/mitochondrial-like isoform X1 [Malania oleifera]|uniref:S-adenosylmethionine carrier 1, chloroplastic/mitochondrial-like isoform X1 n=1 Tax=Malania oleifera TaxID=397392 RepID=UPI0025AEB717|nr:S-adenosylmethionine carrier 1, chloroplastic/mitochondrial-like isoform X1 [Malania oleifera]